MLHLCYSTGQIQKELNGYTVRMLSMVLLITLVVTVSTMLGVERLIIRPVLQLREELLATGESLQAGIRNDDFLRRLPSRSSEMADVIEAFRQLYGQIWYAIEARDRSEQKEKERADQLNEALTQLSQTQAQLLQSEKMAGLGQLVAGIAHEINNPISFIYGNLDPISDYSQDLLTVLQLYQQHCNEPHVSIIEATEALDIEYVQEDLPRLLGSMKSGSERIRDIVRSLRTFSRLDETGLKSVDVHEGLESTLMLLQHRLSTAEGTAPITVIKNYGKLPAIECYAGLLNQVFMNVVMNAIEAIECLSCNATKITGKEQIGKEQIGKEQTESLRPWASGKITLTTTATDDQWISVEIKNNGPTIGDDALTRIYDPFFTTKPVGQGTGMGLAICYQIVVGKHQGKLSCLSSPEQGTAFVMQLPTQQTV